eukprot:GFUD01045540.1.p1 GENE.GFUD01045540.1~~GFUD01045540.1.p1  ORF type:complete len:290 (-),score=50.99 GFUD01045540.1:120-989(-)
MTYQRILVHLQKNASPPVLAKFTECILDSLKIDGHSGQVSCHLKDNKLILSSDTTNENGPKALLTHPPFCPIHCMSEYQATNLPLDISERGVDVGVVVILETSDRNILLTRRAKHMRTFPGIWVPPGGHIEAEEQLLEAGLRELHEETGLNIKKSLKSSRILCLWESVYPYTLSMGQPKRHHIVVYMTVQVEEDKSSLQQCIDLDQGEVDASMWLDPVLAKLIAHDEVPTDCPQFIEATVVDDAGLLKTVKLPAVLMTNKAPDTGADIERISTGTRYAVNQWLAQQGEH